MGQVLVQRSRLSEGGAKVMFLYQLLVKFEGTLWLLKWNARSTRTSFWVGTAIKVIMTIGVLACYLLAFMLLAPFSVTEFDSGDAKVIGVIFIIFIIFFTVAFGPTNCHTVRRLHDAGFNGGWWWLRTCVGQPLLAFLLFHPTVQNEVKWDKYLFDPEYRIRSKLKRSLAYMGMIFSKLISTLNWVYKNSAFYVLNNILIFLNAS